MRLTARAPGKVNLCLFLGPVRPDGRHELVTVFESVSLADVVTVEASDRDEVVCAGVDGVNIVGQALNGLRARGWVGPPVRVVIDKNIPVAGGMGGGSADAAAVLRAARSLAPVSDEDVAELAASLGADVPSQLRPGLSLGTGAGDVIQALDPLAPHAFAIVPQAFGLSTADVYREADRLGLPRDASDLAVRVRQISAGVAAGACQRSRAGVGFAQTADRSRAGRGARHRRRPRDALRLGPDRIRPVSGGGRGAEGRGGGCPSGSIGTLGRPRRPRCARSSRLRAEANRCHSGTIPTRLVSNQSITYLVGACGAVFGFAAFCALVLVPSVTAYRRPLEKAAVVVLSLYVLAALVGVGVLLGALIVVEWPRLF